MYNFTELTKCIEITSVHSIINRRKDKNFYFNGESHPFWEMVFIADGKAGVSADERIYTLSAGEVIFHKPMEFHKIWAAENTQPLCYIISFKATGDYLYKLNNLTAKADKQCCEMMEHIMNTAPEAFSFLRNVFVADNIINEQKSLEFKNLLELFLCRMSVSSTLLEPVKDKDAILFEKAVTFLHANIEKKLTVEDVAQSCFVSTSKIKKLFAKYAGKGLSEYFTEMKINKAMNLLLQDKSVSEVAEELGYSNQFYFCTVFKKYTKSSPSSFKRIRTKHI